MAGPWARASILLRDQGGNICKCVVLVAAAAIDPSGVAVKAIQAAIQAITKAVSPRAETGTQAGAAGATTTGTGNFNNVEDRATLTFRADDNSTYNFEIPGPKETIFLPGTDVVDPADAALLAYTNWISANCKGSFGQDITFVRGERTRKKDFVQG